MTFATADAFARCMTFLRKRLQRRFDLAGAFDVIIHPAARSQVFDDGSGGSMSAEWDSITRPTAPLESATKLPGG